MITFTVALAALIAGYFIYGKLVSRVFGVDPKRATPAYTKQDGVDYIPMPAWKIFMIQFLNIAGLGPYSERSWEPSSARLPTCGSYWAVSSPEPCTIFSRA